uniref:Uncharacterized protein n=1 Tax=Eutreptiella gymnastica TaxID=73025 RepID=A0A7S4CG41_9EUGL
MSILSCGYNGFQNLGTTHENHIVNGDVELLPPTVLQIAAGYSKTYALLESGEVVELSSKLQDRWILPDGVVKLVGGLDVFGAISARGHFYMWGISPAFPKMPHTPTQQEVEFGDVVDASFGNGCILLLTTGGDVHSYGTNANGCLGIPGLLHATKPTLVAFEGLGPDTKISAICCQWGSHCVAINKDGGVVVWGSNSKGQLGLGGGA